MILYGNNFVYNNISSALYNVVLCAFDKEDECPTGLSREVIGTELSCIRPKLKSCGTKYESVLVFKITICHCDGEYFSKSEIRNINKWITSCKDYKELYFLEDDITSGEETRYYAICTNVENITVNGEIAGLKITFTCNSPYGYSLPRSSIGVTEQIVENGGTIYTLTLTINNDTDELEEYIYPKVIITPNTDTVYVSLINLSDNNKSVTYGLSDFQVNVPITFDSERRMITKDDNSLVKLSSVGINEEILHNDGSIYWLRLIPGENQIKITGACRVEIIYSPVVKVGAF